VTLHKLFKVLQSETVYMKNCILIHALLSFVFERFLCYIKSTSVRSRSYKKF